VSDLQNPHHTFVSITTKFNDVSFVLFTFACVPWGFSLPSFFANGMNGGRNQASLSLIPKSRSHHL
jgi:hypothetical protein